MQVKQRLVILRNLSKHRFLFRISNILSIHLSCTLLHIFSKPDTLIKQQMQVSLSTRQVFDHSDMQSMTKQQRHFAQQQLRHIFSHQMSKVSVALDRRRQVSTNLHSLSSQYESHLQSTFNRLNQRMSHVDSKRKQNIQKKIESCRTYDEQWRGRVGQVERRLRKESRDAEAKIKKFREQHEEYLRKKEQRMSEINEKRSSQWVQPRVGADQQRARTQLVQGISESTPKGYLTSRMKRSRLDKEISNHKIRSQQIQLDKEHEVLQKALAKIDTIYQRRKKITSSLVKQQEEGKVQKKRSSTRVEGYKRKNDDDQKRNRSSMAGSPSVGKSLKKLPQINHMESKKEQQLKQFRERGYILQKNTERTKKQQIIRQIKQKVTQYKVLAQRSS